MKKKLKTTLALLVMAMASMAQNVEMTGPDGRLRLKVVNEGETGVSYSVTYDAIQTVDAVRIVDRSYTVLISGGENVDFSLL